MGIDVDGRWGVARLEEEIAEAQKKPKQRAPSQEEPQPEAEGTVQAVEAENAAQPTSDAVERGDSAPAHGRYHRRDMQAEE
jgi:hypothetical protein